MGLDMFAYSVDEEMHPLGTKLDGDVVGGRPLLLSPEDGSELDEASYSWRKHTKLHQWMNDYFHELLKNGNISVSDEHTENMWAGVFNCIPLYLPMDKLFDLKYLIEDDDLPESDGGFFWGQDFQDETAAEYKPQDLEFCDWAIKESDNGNFIYYSCWF